MQIDFHHAVTYVVARLAGLDAADAGIVATAAQYVDDATADGTVRFQNGALYARISSAHKMFDYRNLAMLNNQRVWIPFHFLPGNGGLPAGASPEGSFLDKLICRPDSPVARDMVRMVIERKDVPFALHRLGITMHVYADTWAHQGFVGMSHDVNDATDVRGADDEPDHGLMDRLGGFFVGELFPVGHGAVLGHPDKPYLVWSYQDGRGQRVVRDNPTDFLAAVDAMYRTIRRWRLGDPDAAVPPMPDADRAHIATLFREIRDADNDARHRAWLGEIALGAFSFGPETPSYVAKGPGSWKWAALGLADAAEEDTDEALPFQPDFLQSDWKLFHDALQVHRTELLHYILPRYGICTA